MRLTAKTDLDAPVEFVHAALCDSAAWEREAIRRGVEVERPAGVPLSGAGAAWQIRGHFRGRMRQVLLRIDEIVPDQSLSLSFDGKALAGSSQLETRALSPRRSRMRVTIEVKPKTLAARLFLNTLRIARGKVETRLENRVHQLANRIAERYAREKV